jgi:hypothetical protein
MERLVETIGKQPTGYHVLDGSRRKIQIRKLRKVIIIVIKLLY